MHKRPLCALCMRDVVWVCVVRVCVKAGKRCRTLILSTGQGRAGKVPFGGSAGCSKEGGRVLRVGRVYLFSPSRVPPFGLGFQAAAFG